MLETSATKNERAAATAVERPSFDAVYEREFDYVWTTLRRMGVAESSLADAAHDVFVVVFRRLGDFDPTRPLRPWLFGIAYRVAADRRALAYNRRESPAELPDIESDGPSAEQALDRSQRRAMVHEALAKVDENQRVVLVAHDLEERPMAEIAAELEIPVKTAYSRLRLAREALTKALERALLRRGERP
ncbi:MAG: sigma-70 family RNA polymerase sigma factor [Myxococcales bacterium]|nr:sigma-70 family RNA polymerase sigma factor [Myxococcales bacterium]